MVCDFDRWCKTLVALLFFLYGPVAIAFVMPTDSLINEWRRVERGTVKISEQGKANLLLQLGDLLNYESPDSAIYFYTLALNHCNTEGLEKSKASILNKLGYAHYILGNYERSLGYCVDAFEINQALNDNAGMSMSLNYIALVYETQGNYKKSFEYQWKSITYSLQSSDKNRLNSNYFNLAILHDDVANYDSAILYLDRSMALSKQSNNVHMTSMSMNRMGEVYLHMGDYVQAERYYFDVLNFKDYQDKWENCFAYAGLAQVYHKLKQYDKSISNGLISLGLAREMKSKWEIAQDAKILYESYKSQSKFTQALGMHELYKQYSDSLFNESKEREINALHLRQNEMERDQLSKENALQLATLQQYYLWIGIFAVVGIALTILIVVLYRGYRQKLLLNKQLVRKNDGIANRNATIETQIRELNALNETKNQLLSIIGHDMRSPINNIKTVLGIIKDGNLSHDDQQKVFADFYRTIGTVSDTMNNMLSWASNQLNGLQINPKEIQISQLIDQKVEFFSRAAMEKGITLVHERSPGIYAYADIDHLKTAIRNIISNAIKFTHRNGKVTISYEEGVENIIIRIVDTGVGIENERLNQIFKFNGRSKSIGTSNERGTGIGLMLSKEFIESNNGKIEVASELTRGTRFTIQLPKASLPKAYSLVTV